MGLLPKPFSALIIGASGTIGSSFVKLLESHPACSKVVGIHRNSDHAIDYHHPESIEASAGSLSESGPFQLIINTIGVLHSEQWMPEKKLDDLNQVQLTEMFNTNTIGPALTIKYFSKLLDPKHGVMATLSAKVGSIEDNRLGGWYGYRASKAALNMYTRHLAFRLQKQKIIVSGVIRPYDITSDNSINSSQIADLKLSYDKDGIEADILETPWGLKLMRTIWPF